MMNVKGELADDREPAELGRAAVVRPGTDVTVVATQLMRVRAEQAARALAGEGISVELIDPRTLVPLDVATVGASLERTGRLLIVQESPFGGSWGATLIASLCSTTSSCSTRRRPSSVATTRPCPTPALSRTPGCPHPSASPRRPKT